MLTEVNRFPDQALPLEDCKAHLRLASGFADDGAQDALVAGYLRAAILAIEARTGKVLLARDFRLRLRDWKDAHGQPLPVAPVREVKSLTLLSRMGVAEAVAAEGFRLEVDVHRPLLRPVGWLLPSVPTGGSVEVVFEAGFGPEWADVPADLAQAVMMLTAQYHENRHGAVGLSRGGAIPFDVLALIERWRVIRVTAAGVR